MLVQQNVQMRFVAESIRRIVGCGDSTHRYRASGTKFPKCLLPTVSRDSPCGCPLSAVADTNI